MIRVPRIKDPPQIGLDKFSVVHAGAGFAMGALGFSRQVAYGLILLVELIEFIASRLGAKFLREPSIDIAFDIGIGFATYELGRMTR